MFLAYLAHRLRAAPVDAKQKLGQQFGCRGAVVPVKPQQVLVSVRDDVQRVCPGELLDVGLVVFRRLLLELVQLRSVSLLARLVEHGKVGVHGGCVAIKYDVEDSGVAFLVLSYDPACQVHKVGHPLALGVG